MINKNPELLNLEAKVKSSSRNFFEIPIWFPSSYGSFGDIMINLKLAEGMKKEFPDKKVTFYFGRKEDYQELKRLYPHFDPNILEASLNGVSVAQVSDLQMREIMSKNLIGIYSPVAVSEIPSLKDFLIDAKINFYLEEYDASEKIRLPERIKRNIFL